VLRQCSFPHRTPEALSAWLDQQPAKELASEAAVLLLALRTLNRLILALPESLALIRVLDDRARPLLGHLGRRQPAVCARSLHGRLSRGRRTRR